MRPGCESEISGVAGRPGVSTWVLIDEITDTAVYFRAIDPEEAERRGLPALKGGGLAGRVELVDAGETYQLLSAGLAAKRATWP